MQNSELQRWQGILAFLLVAILFGSITPVTKWTISYLTPIVLISVSYMIAVILFIPWILKIFLSSSLIQAWKNQISVLSLIPTKTIDLKNLSGDAPETRLIIDNLLLRDSFVLGVLTFGIHLGLSFGVKTISANRASFLFGLGVIFVSLLDLMYRKRFSLRIFLAAILAFGGSGLMSWEQSSEPLIGSLWILGAIGCEATILVLLEDMAPRHDPLMFSILRLVVTATLALFLGIAELSNQLSVIQSNWLPLLYLGFVTAATSWLISFALQTLPAAEAALIQALEPIFGAIISFLVLGEVFGWRGLIGSGLILIGTTFTIWNSSTGFNESNHLTTDGESRY